MLHTYMIDITDAHHATWQRLYEWFDNCIVTNFNGVKYITLDALPTAGITPALIAEITGNDESNISMRVIKRY